MLSPGARVGYQRDKFVAAQLLASSRRLSSLLLVGGYADIALRDFGLLVGALALSRLASAHAVRN
jgi:hypothetical protein